MKDEVTITVEEKAEIVKIDGELPKKKKRTGKFYEQEFPVLEPRPLTELERMASAQRGFIRRDRQRTRKQKRGNR